jgi:serine/threonine-protein kinase
MTRIAVDRMVGKTLRSTGRDLVIEQLLASGGIAHVFLARPANAKDERFAVKLLRPEMEQRSDVVARFEREALAASRVHSDNVVAVFEPVQRWGGLSYFACEYLEGVDLADLLTLKKGLAPTRAIRILMGAARGLGAAHEAGVVHRDVKPENIFVVHRPDGRETTKVLDFGAAWLDGDARLSSASLRLTTLHSIVGTPGYMPPEQADAALAHPTADIYSLGVVLFEALSGRPPFSGRNWVEVVHKHLTETPPLLRSVSSDLARVVEKSLQKRPEDRFESMAALEAALALVPEASADSSPPRP